MKSKQQSKALSLDLSGDTTCSLASRKPSRCHSVPPAPPEHRDAATEWLLAHGCQPRLDSFRDGTLLCELVEKLTNKVVRAIAAPQDERDVETNFRSALAAVRRANPPSFSKHYYQRAQELADGSENLWGFYWALYNAFCDVLPPRLASAHPALKYDILGICRLERSLLSWLRRLGVAEAACITEMQPAIANGTLLADTVSAALSVVLEGVFPQPRSEGAALSNLRKALDVLKRTPYMSQKFVWGYEKAWLRCELGPVLGLLEDLHRHCEGHQPRNSEEPFLGRPEVSSTGSAEAPKVCCPRNRIELGAFATDLLPCRQTTFDEQPLADPLLEPWLVQRLVPQEAVESLRCGKAELFTDGVLLWDLVSTLEHSQLEGVERRPANPAASRHNLRLVLQHLEKKPSFPKALCYVEEDLLRGVSKVWKRLLSAVRRLYPNSLGVLRRRRRNSVKLTNVC